MALDTLIIGGGIHGVHIAARLLGETELGQGDIRILDPSSQLLARWRARTKVTGMTHLRSPAVHHLDIEPWSLRRFAEEGSQKRRLFARPYDRPSLELFNEHCDAVIDEFGIKRLHRTERATKIRIRSGGVSVSTQSENIYVARNVVLAVGNAEQPERPEWAKGSAARIHHVFESGSDGWPSENAESVAVIGGGLSAAQVAIRLVGEGHAVHLVSRHALREHQFDSDPGWLGPKYMRDFRRERSAARRREVIQRARHSGSVTPATLRKLRRCFERGTVKWHQATVQEASRLRGGRSKLRFSAGTAIHVDRILLATGFSAHRPGGEMVDDLIRAHSLPCAECGYPLIDSNLRWHPGVFVTGPLAELELGPAARNIAGARRAGDCLVQEIQARDQSAIAS